MTPSHRPSARWLALVPLAFLALLLAAPVLRLLAEGFGDGDLGGSEPLRWLALWQRDTALELNPAAAARLQDVAVGIARVMFLGWFGRLPSRDQLLEELALGAAA